MVVYRPMREPREDRITKRLAWFGASWTPRPDAARALVKRSLRYLALYVVDDEFNLLDTAGKGDPRPDLLNPTTTFRAPGMTGASEGEVGGTPVPIIQQFAPLPEETFATGEEPPAPEEETRRRAVVGHYDPYFFRFSLRAAEPGEVWLVDREGRVIGSREAFTAFQQLPRRPSREAAARAVNGESGVQVEPGSLGLQEVVSYAPVAGDGPAGDLGWGVVVARSVGSISLPETDARRQGLLFAGLLALFVVVVFGWLYIIVLNPLFRLQREAERLANGDLSHHVEIVRYDEIGLVARALERIRVALIRRRVRKGPPKADGNGEERPSEEDGP